MTTEEIKQYLSSYYYLSKKREELPFEIKGVMFGPRYHNTDNFQDYISKVLGNSIELSHSEIIGYR